MNVTRTWSPSRHEHNSCGTSVLVADPNDHSRPYVQPAGPNQGFFVSEGRIAA